MVDSGSNKDEKQVNESMMDYLSKIAKVSVLDKSDV